VAWLRLAPTVLVAGLAVWAGVTVWGWKVERDALRGEVTALERSVAALEWERDRAREARAVARAHVARVEAAREAQAVALARVMEDIEDAPISDDTCRALRELGFLCPADAD